jgi:AcrR family transcriptional regulator
VVAGVSPCRPLVGWLGDVEMMAPVLNKAMTSRNAQVRRAQIVTAAVEVFAELGYDGASLREVGLAAGMEKGHLSYYFPTKKDLLFEIVNDLHDQFLVGMVEWPGDPDDREDVRLYRLLRAHAELVCILHLQVRVAYESMRFLSADRQVLVTKKRDHYEAELAKLIDGWRATGSASIAPTHVATKAILGMLNWSYYWYRPEGPDSPAQIADIISSQAFASLQPRLVGKSVDVAVPQG